MRRAKCKSDAFNDESKEGIQQRDNTNGTIQQKQLCVSLVSCITIASFHRYGPKSALSYKVNALRQFAVSLSSSKPNNTNSPTALLVKQRAELETKRLGLIQRLDQDEENTVSSLRRNQILATSDLYRLATILYLQRVCPFNGDQATRQAYLEQALSAYAKLHIATSPWPLFVIACESSIEQQ